MPNLSLASLQSMDCNEAKKNCRISHQPLCLEKHEAEEGVWNGAKETRTPDPLHAMQVLYQLSYGPIAASAVGDCRDVVHHTRPASLQTPTSRPWMVTWSAGSSSGA